MQAFVNRLRPLCLLLVTLLVTEPVTPAFSREDISVKNVRFDVFGGKIVVHYDLTGPTDRSYLVKVTVRRTQLPTYEYSPRTISGDVGQGKFSGSNREITWEILREYPNGIEGSDFYFRVEATLLTPGSNLLYYLTGGAAAIGAAAYFIFIKKSSVSDEGSFPQPVGRPSTN